MKDKYRHLFNLFVKMCIEMQREYGFDNDVYEYKTNKGDKIKDKETLEYIRSLKIPPAYEKVKINLNKNSKLLVTGYDVKGKKQYIYNEKWIEMRSQQKFCNMIDFGKVF